MSFFFYFAKTLRGFFKKEEKLLPLGQAMGLGGGHRKDMGVPARHGGFFKLAGWFISWKIRKSQTKIWMMTGGTPMTKRKPPIWMTFIQAIPSGLQRLWGSGNRMGWNGFCMVFEGLNWNCWILTKIYKVEVTTQVSILAEPFGSICSMEDV